MKKIILTFSFLYCSISLSAQNTFPSSGNVGIGTGSPVTLLHINGGTTMTAGWNKTSTLEATYPVQIFNSNATKWAGIGYDFSNALRFWVNATSDDLVSSGTNAMSIMNNGNVSIGPFSSPDYKLSVAGTIRSKEVIVETADWPDYVFKKSYELPSLDQVKTYIDQYGHLRELPSEQQIAKEGVNLGEMNKLLVKKIEELTLYLIENDKELKSQRHEVEMLKQQLDTKADKKALTKL